MDVTLGTRRWDGYDHEECYSSKQVEFESPFVIFNKFSAREQPHPDYIKLSSCYYIGRDTMSSIMLGRAMREARDERRREEDRQEERRQAREEARWEREHERIEEERQAREDARKAREEAEWKRHHPDFAAYCKDDFQKIEEPEFDPDDTSIADMFKTLEEI